jgi:hypothetical protein
MGANFIVAKKPIAIVLWSALCSAEWFAAERPSSPVVDPAEHFHPILEANGR